MKTIEKKLIIDKNDTIEIALKRLRKTKRGCLVVTSENKLFGTITDGDLRKFIIQKKSLNTKIRNACNKNPKYLIQNKYSQLNAKRIFSKLIDVIPVVDENKQVKKILFKNTFNVKKKNTKSIFNDVIIMAGGKGARLQPFTKILPKPLIPVKGKAIILRIIEKFIKNGFKKIYLSVNYKSKILEAFFSEVNLKKNINFVYEKKPLGTIGAITKINKKFDKPIIITNCDVIFNFDYSNIIYEHKRKNNFLTLAISNMKYTIEHGACEINRDKSLLNISEKPTIKYLINTGFYVVSPEVIKFIPKNKYFDITN